ncbi:MAG: divalent-cation tolerance protein CutA [Pseudomonadota bacterium]
MTAALTIIQTTVASAEEAEKLARALVDRRLAACVQFTTIRSVYRWGGEVQAGSEVRLDIKTSGVRQGDLINGLKELHPYDVPELIVLHADSAGEGYAKWVAEETAV